MSVIDAILGLRRSEHRAEVVRSYDESCDAPPGPMWGLLEDRIHPTSGRLIGACQILVRRGPSK
jgi:hypothetical protein